MYITCHFFYVCTYIHICMNIRPANTFQFSQLNVTFLFRSANTLFYIVCTTATPITIAIAQQQKQQQQQQQHYYYYDYQHSVRILMQIDNSYTNKQQARYAKIAVGLWQKEFKKDNLFFFFNFYGKISSKQYFQFLIFIAFQKQRWSVFYYFHCICLIVIGSLLFMV